MMVRAMIFTFSRLKASRTFAKRPGLFSRNTEICLVVSTGYLPRKDVQKRTEASLGMGAAPHAVRQKPIVVCKWAWSNKDSSESDAQARERWCSLPRASAPPTCRGGANIEQTPTAGYNCPHRVLMKPPRRGWQ